MAVKPRDSISFYETVDMMNKMPIKPEETSVPDDPVSKFLMNLGALSLGVSPSEYAKIHGEDAGINYGIGQAAYGGLFALAGMASAKGTQSQQIANDMETLTNAAGLTYKGLDPNKEIIRTNPNIAEQPIKQFPLMNKRTQAAINAREATRKSLLRSASFYGRFERGLRRFPKEWEAQKELYKSGRASVIDINETMGFYHRFSKAPNQFNMPDKALAKRIKDLNLTPNALNTIIDKNEQQGISLQKMLEQVPVTTDKSGMATIYRLDNLAKLMEQGGPRIHGEADTRGRWSSDSYDIVKGYASAGANVISTMKTPADNLLFVRRNELGNAKTGEYVIRDLSKVDFIKHDFLDSESFPIEQQYSEQPIFETRPDLAPNIQSKLVPLLKSINAIDAFSKEYPALGELIKSGKPYIKNNN